MKTKQLGNSGLMVSELALGCMTYGEPDRGGHPWTLPMEQSAPMLRQAYQSGINFFDTANSYSDGSSEEILGQVLWEMAPRHEIVLATKLFLGGPAHLKGLSRRAIFAQVDMSLARLKTDYIDLYQIHRWDNVTPVEETMEALHDVVKAGKVRYLGASSMYAWQFAKLQEAARHNRWTPFVSMQNQVNLIYREEEREMIPLCLDQGVGLIPWSPIARGRLARPFGVETPRTSTDGFGKVLYDNTAEQDARVISTVEEVAIRLGRSMAQVALAWVRQKLGVVAPIIGASRVEQLNDATAGLDLVLDAQDIEILEQHYVPHAVVGQE